MSLSGRSSSSSNTAFSSDRSVASSVASCSSARALPSLPRPAASADSAEPDTAVLDTAAPDTTLAADTVVPDSAAPGSASAAPPWDIRASPAAGSAGVQQANGDVFIPWPAHLPARRWQPTLAAVTPGRSLTASVLGRGPTPNIRTLFNIERKALGEGQYGKVYVCTEKATGVRYACKTIARSTLISVEDVEDVRMEVSVLFRLQGQPNVVRVHSTYEDRRDIHIVMELCSGGELFDEINRRCDEMTVPYSERDAAKLCKAVVRAVHSCHSSGVIHRDLKPENFLFSTAGPDAVLKAADFGMAAYFKPGEGFTRVCGSCMYMAPEVIRIWENLGKQRYGPPVDIWACGVIFYILLAGNYPFLPPGPDRSERAFRRVILQPQRLFREAVWGRISADAKSLISAMLHPDPALRPTAKQVLADAKSLISAMLHPDPALRPTAQQVLDAMLHPDPALRPSAQQVLADAKSLISAMLHPDPNLRPTAQQVLDEPLEKDVVDRFKQFLYVMRLNKVKKVALRVSQAGGQPQCVSLQAGCVWTGSEGEPIQAVPLRHAPQQGQEGGAAVRVSRFKQFLYVMRLNKVKKVALRVSQAGGQPQCVSLQAGCVWTGSEGEPIQAVPLRHAPQQGQEGGAAVRVSRFKQFLYVMRLNKVKKVALRVSQAGGQPQCVSLQAGCVWTGSEGEPIQAVPLRHAPQQGQEGGAAVRVSRFKQFLYVMRLNKVKKVALRVSQAGGQPQCVSLQAGCVWTGSEGEPIQAVPLRHAPQQGQEGGAAVRVSRFKQFLYVMRLNKVKKVALRVSQAGGQPQCVSLQAGCVWTGSEGEPIQAVPLRHAPQQGQEGGAAVRVSRFKQFLYVMRLNKVKKVALRVSQAGGQPQCVSLQAGCVWTGSEGEPIQAVPLRHAPQQGQEGGAAVRVSRFKQFLYVMRLNKVKKVALRVSQAGGQPQCVSLQAGCVWTGSEGEPIQAVPLRHAPQQGQEGGAAVRVSRFKQFLYVMRLNKVKKVALRVSQAGGQPQCVSLQAGCVWTGSEGEPIQAVPLRHAPQQGQEGGAAVRVSRFKQFLYVMRLNKVKKVALRVSQAGGQPQCVSLQAGCVWTGSEGEPIQAVPLRHAPQQGQEGGAAVRVSRFKQFLYVMRLNKVKKVALRVSQAGGQPQCVSLQAGCVWTGSEGEPIQAVPLRHAPQQGQEGGAAVRVSRFKQFLYVMRLNKVKKVALRVSQAGGQPQCVSLQAGCVWTGSEGEPIQAVPLRHAPQQGQEGGAAVRVSRFKQFLYVMRLNKVKKVALRVSQAGGQPQCVSLQAGCVWTGSEGEPIQAVPLRHAPQQGQEGGAAVRVSRFKQFLYVMRINKVKKVALRVSQAGGQPQCVSLQAGCVWTGSEGEPIQAVPLRHAPQQGQEGGAAVRVSRFKQFLYVMRLNKVKKVALRVSQAGGQPQCVSLQAGCVWTGSEGEPIQAVPLRHAPQQGQEGGAAVRVSRFKQFLYVMRLNKVKKVALRVSQAGGQPQCVSLQAGCVWTGSEGEPIQAVPLRHAPQQGQEGGAAVRVSRFKQFLYVMRLNKVKKVALRVSQAGGQPQCVSLQAGCVWTGSEGEPIQAVPLRHAPQQGQEGGAAVRVSRFKQFLYVMRLNKVKKVALRVSQAGGQPQCVSLQAGCVWTGSEGEPIQAVPLRHAPQQGQEGGAAVRVSRFKQFLYVMRLNKVKKVALRVSQAGGQPQCVSLQAGCVWTGSEGEPIQAVPLRHAPQQGQEGGAAVRVSRFKQFLYVMRLNKVKKVALRVSQAGGQPQCVSLQAGCVWTGSEGEPIQAVPLRHAPQQGQEGGAAVRVSRFKQFLYVMRLNKVKKVALRVSQAGGQPQCVSLQAGCVWTGSEGEPIQAVPLRHAPQQGQEGGAAVRVSRFKQFLYVMRLNKVKKVALRVSQAGGQPQCVSLQAGCVWTGSEGEPIQAVPLRHAPQQGQEGGAAVRVSRFKQFLYVMRLNKVKKVALRVSQAGGQPQCVSLQAGCVWTGSEGEPIQAVPLRHAPQQGQEGGAAVRVSRFKQFLYVMRLNKVKKVALRVTPQWRPGMLKVDRFKQFLYVMRLKKVALTLLPLALLPFLAGEAMVEGMEEDDIWVVQGDLARLDPYFRSPYSLLATPPNRSRQAMVEGMREEDIRVVQGDLARLDPVVTGKATHTGNAMRAHVAGAFPACHPSSNPSQQAMVEGMREEDIRVVQGDLARLDPNASGVVPIEALPHALHSRGFHGPADAVASIIHEICLDGKVAFDYADFFVALLQLCSVEQQESLFQAFSVFDQDLSGYISGRVDYNYAAYPCASMAPHLAPPSLVQPPLPTPHQAGRVDYNEFVAMMRMQAGGVSRRTIERHMDNGSIKEMDAGGASGGPYDGDSDDMRSDAAFSASDATSVGNGGGF
ncbi:unnamed protein product [Closterium sp. Yama58-4]|nr:unnamed protein product [Closterium sp. Yama58-4]